VVQPTDTPVPPPPCVPNCAGQNCGEDGCGGSCGTCTQGQQCNASGQCAGASCKPDAEGCSSSSECCSGNCDTRMRVRACMPRVGGPGRNGW
jgi:hypothetical protein